MARKVETVIVPNWEGNRDSGKQFLITEMSAMAAEKWALRAFLALKGSEERIPDNVRGLGMVGVAIIGLNVFLRGTPKHEDLVMLMDEMMLCVQCIRDRNHPDVGTPIVSDDDVEEVQTLGWLRSEVIRIHTGFSLADSLSKLISDVAELTTSLTTSTSAP